MSIFGTKGTNETLTLSLERRRLSESESRPSVPKLERGKFLTLAFVAQSAMIAVSFVLGWWLGIPLWDYLRGGALAVLYGILLGLPLVGLAIAFAELPWRAFAQMRKDFAMVVHLFGNCTVLDIFLISALAGIGEEALFRGVLQTFVAEHWGLYAGIGVASLVFGGLHAISSSYVVYVTFAGLYLGVIFWQFDNLIVPMLVHTVYNFLALVYATRIRPIEIPEDFFQDTENTI
jgi:membrane protease YdiL (CAAX protease family)